MESYMITISLALAFCIFVWLKTNAFIDFFGWTFKRRNFLYIREYNEQPETIRNNLHYPLWLYTRHRNMFTKLLSCPLCLSFWSNLIFARSFRELLAGAFITLLFFSVLDRMYKHG